MSLLAVQRMKIDIFPSLGADWTSALSADSVGASGFDNDNELLVVSKQAARELATVEVRGPRDRVASVDLDAGRRWAMRDDAFGGMFSYNTDLFARETVEQLVADGVPVTWGQVQGLAGGTVGDVLGPAKPDLGEAVVDRGAVGQRQGGHDVVGRGVSDRLADPTGYVRYAPNDMAGKVLVCPPSAARSLMLHPWARVSAQQSR